MLLPSPAFRSLIRYPHRLEKGKNRLLRRLCKGLKGYPKDYRGIRITGVYKGLPGFTRVYKGLHGITRVFKGLHGCTRVIQGFKWDYRGMQGITGI